MSYYRVNPSYFKNPPPSYGPSGDTGSAVPGWGVAPNAAGPRRLGVGSVGLGDMCLAKDVLLAKAKQLYPQSDAQQLAYVLTQGPGFSAGPDGWAAWCAQQSPYACPAHQALVATAKQLFPQSDAQQFAYVLTHGPGFAGDWITWCAQQTGKVSATQQTTPTTTDTGGGAAQPASSGFSVPWWVWVALPVAIGGGAAVAYEAGWFGKK